MKEIKKYLTKRNYIKSLALFYFIGFLLHIFDFFDLRLEFSKMRDFEKKWILFLTVGDCLVSLLLIYKERYGVVLFHVVALSQLYTYIFYKNDFGPQNFLVIFHVVTLVLFWKFIANEKKEYYKNPSQK